jgi:hypothetical protein
MKLLLCKTCGDVFNLQRHFKSCGCGLASGKYTDNLYAEYSGGIPIGFNNSSLVKALLNQPENGMGERFEAFIIPKECPTMNVKRLEILEELSKLDQELGFQ